MYPIVEILVVLAFCTLIGLNNVAMAIYGVCVVVLKAIRFMLTRMFRKAYVPSAENRILKALAKRQEKQVFADAALTPAVTEQSADPLPTTKCATIHRRKYRNNTVRATLFQYDNEIKRTVWLREQKGKKSVMVRKVLAPIIDLTLEKAWAITRAEVLAMTERKPRTQQSSNIVPESSVAAPAIEQAQPVVAAVATPAPTVAAPAPATEKSEKLERPVEWVGKVIEMGRAQRTDVPKPYYQYRIRIKSEIDTEENVWGADLSRVVEESGVVPGDTVHIRFLGKRPVPVQEGDSTVTKMKNIYEISRVSN